IVMASVCPGKVPAGSSAANWLRVMDPRAVKAGRRRPRAAFASQLRCSAVACCSRASNPCLRAPSKNSPKGWRANAADGAKNTTITSWNLINEFLLKKYKRGMGVGGRGRVNPCDVGMKTDVRRPQPAPHATGDRRVLE